MIPQYAGTPTGTGPALPQYLSDADIQAARERALCDVDSFADWLMGECMSETAYDGGRSSRHYAEERALVIDYSKAESLSTPDLLALAMGLASNPRARIAALDELGARYLRAQNLRLGRAHERHHVGNSE